MEEVFRAIPGEAWTPGSLAPVTKVISVLSAGAHDSTCGLLMFQSRNWAEELVKQENSFKWLPVIIEEFCTNCGLCIAACGPACLETQNLVAVLARPNDCGSEEHCISACPEDAIHMVWLPSEGNHSIGLWRPVAHMNPEFGSIGAGSPAADSGSS